MKLFRISQSVNKYYDTYDSAVVAAESAEDAKTIHPAGSYISMDNYYLLASWTTIDNVSAEYIGKAAPGVERGPIVSSFNAG